MNKFDKIIYNRFIGSHPVQGYVTSMNTEERDEVYNLVEYFYKGAAASGKFMQALDEVNKVQLLRRSTKGNLWRSVQAVYDLLQFVKNPKDLISPGTTKEEDFKASIQNLYTGDMFENHLEQSQDAQNKADLLVYSPNGEGSFNIPSKEEIEFRNWLMRQTENNSKVRNILEFFGTFLAHANALVRENYVPSVANVSDIKRGGDLGKVLPDELLSLGAEEMELLFYYGLATQNLLQYDCKQKENVAKGDLVLLLDISGSMSEPVSRSSKYSKLDMALGFTLAMLKILEKQGRSCKLFAYNVMCMEVFDTRRTSPETVFKTVLNINADGGTKIQSALNQVFSKTTEDVIIITDGIDDTLNAARIKEWKQDRRLSCLLISEYAPQGLKIRNAVDSFIVANGEDGFKHLTKEFI